MNAIKYTNKFLNQKITLKDVNDLILRKAILSAKNSGKFFNKGSALINDALKD